MPEPDRPMKNFLYRSDHDRIEGPLPSDTLRRKVATGKLPLEVSVCEEGSDNWVSFTDLPDTDFSPELLEEERRRFESILHDDGALEYMEPVSSPFDWIWLAGITIASIFLIAAILAAIL